MKIFTFVDGNVIIITNRELGENKLFYNGSLYASFWKNEKENDIVYEQVI